MSLRLHHRYDTCDLLCVCKDWNRVRGHDCLDLTLENRVAPSHQRIASARDTDARFVDGVKRRVDLPCECPVRAAQRLPHPALPNSRRRELRDGYRVAEL